MSEYIRFNDADLEILTQEESERHRHGSRLHFGAKESTEMPNLCLETNIFYIDIADFKTAIPKLNHLGYKKVDRCTSARLTLFGGIKIKRVDIYSKRSYHKQTAELSGEEYKTLLNQLN